MLALYGHHKAAYKFKLKLFELLTVKFYFAKKKTYLKVQIYFEHAMNTQTHQSTSCETGYLRLKAFKVQ